MGGIRKEKDRPFIACSNCLHHFSIEKIGGRFMEVQCPKCNENLQVAAIFIANSNASFVNYLVKYVQEIAVPLACELLRIMKKENT
jgi:ssDNA-binding Zn-finger/Zn-ribbon topoisomerase 1